MTPSRVPLMMMMMMMRWKKDSSRALWSGARALKHGPARRSGLKHELRITQQNERRRRRAPLGLVLDYFPWNGKTTFPQERINKPKSFFFFLRKRCLSDSSEVNSIIAFSNYDIKERSERFNYNSWSFDYITFQR